LGVLSVSSDNLNPNQTPLLIWFYVCCNWLIDRKPVKLIFCFFYFGYRFWLSSLVFMPTTTNIWVLLFCLVDISVHNTDKLCRLLLNTSLTPVRCYGKYILLCINPLTMDQPSLQKLTSCSTKGIFNYCCCGWVQMTTCSVLC
jgi:hypothetical protein